MSALQPDDPFAHDPAGDPEHPSSWLVGPDEGLAAEIARTETEPPLPRPTLLRRPGSSDSLQPPPVPPSPSQVGRVIAEPDSGSGFESGPGAMAWAPGGTSVPSLRRVAPAYAAPEPTRDFPMDDAEERAMGGASYIAHDEEAPPPHTVVNPEAFDVHAPATPWWMQILHAIGGDRRIQVLIGLVLIALVAVAMWPRGERPMSVGAVRRQAAHLDGVSVYVAGKVGQVFPVGGGYAYYLHDGKDTLVVFTRVTHPMSRRPIKVRGTMSIGYLDGQPTPALFESNTPQ
jgi:hypothetical protein